MDLNEYIHPKILIKSGIQMVASSRMVQNVYRVLKTGLKSPVLNVYETTDHVNTVGILILDIRNTFEIWTN